MTRTQHFLIGISERCITLTLIRYTTPRAHQSTAATLTAKSTNGQMNLLYSLGVKNLHSSAVDDGWRQGQTCMGDAVAELGILGLYLGTA